MKTVFENPCVKKHFLQKSEMTNSFAHPTSLSWRIQLNPRRILREDIKHTLLIDFWKFLHLKIFENHF